MNRMSFVSQGLKHKMSTLTCKKRIYYEGRMLIFSQVLVGASAMLLLGWAKADYRSG